MSVTETILKKIETITAAHGASAYGFADLAGLTPEPLKQFNGAISFLMDMEPRIMTGLTSGPTPEYAELYKSRNVDIDSLASELAQALETSGYQAWPVPASVRSDTVNIRGDFQHKTAATRAGHGWIGRHCQLVNFKLGPWLRLGTVLTDAPLPYNKPVEKTFCGECNACVEACPAGALTGGDWTPGVARDVILDAWACDEYKKTHFQGLPGHHICGICTAACPFGQKRTRLS